jgi:predicted amidohydrolase YtcJ
MSAIGVNQRVTSDRALLEIEMRWWFLGFVLLGYLPAQAQPNSADLVLEHGVILTVDGQDHIVQALAIKDGRLLALGSDGDIAGLVGPKTRVIDLAGKTATPGLIDTHAHILHGGLIDLYQIDLSQTASVSAILDLVRARAKSMPPGQWIIGEGWNEGVIAEHRPPSLAELDAVSDGHPVQLRHVSGHFVMVNSVVLKLLRLSSGSPNPPGGTIDRDNSGQLTGLLKESAQDLALAIDPPPSMAQRETAIGAAIRQMNTEGMTGVKDPLLQPQEWAAYLDLARKGGLTAHVCGLMQAGISMESAQRALDEVVQARKDVAAIRGNDLNVCGVKIFMDGAFLARTAWMNEDYPADATHHAPTGRGYPTVQPDTYRRMVRLFTRADVTIGTHVIGDRGSDFVADTYAQALAETPRMGLRHSIIHMELPSAHALEVVAMLQRRYDSGIVETQAEFLWALGGALPGAVGPELAKHLIPLATYARRGIRYASSSDYPVTPLPARYGLWASVAREPLTKTAGTHPFGTAEAADVHAALRSYTIAGARQMFLEKNTGSLEVGKWADIAVWDRNPYAVPTAQLKDMRCLLTIYKGRTVFQQ